MNQINVEQLETILQKAWTLGYKEKDYYTPHYPFVRLCSESVVVWKKPFAYIFAIKCLSPSEAEKLYKKLLKDHEFNKGQSYDDCKKGSDCFMEEQNGMILLPPIPTLYEYEKDNYSELQYADKYCKPSERQAMQ